MPSPSTWVVAIDPPAIVPTRTELNLNSGPIAVDQEGIDWGEAAIQAYMAEQRWGSATVDYRVPNRQIVIPLGLGMTEHGETEEEARNKLQQKVGLLQREGGVLKRQRVGGEPLYADIVNATLHLPDKFGETHGVEDKVELHLECLPDFYGEEIELDSIIQENQVIGVLQKSGSAAKIAGDYPARCRIVLKDEGNLTNLKGTIWSFRARNYASATSAASFFDAYKLSVLNGATTGAEASAYSGKALKLTTPSKNAWHPFCYTDTAGVPVTHVGTYRVFARVKCGAGARLRFSWSTDDATAPINNEPFTFPGSEWMIVDLGEIRIEEPPVGEHWWRGFFEIETGGTTNPITLDRMWLQNLDETAGKLRATQAVTSFLLSNVKEPTSASESTTEAGSTAWGKTGQLYTVTLNASESEYLFRTSLGFAIPTGAEIKGIELCVAGGGGLVISNKASTFTVQALKAGVAAGTAKTAVNNSTSSVGGSADLWGTTWTPAQINAAGFGFRIKALDTSQSSNQIWLNPLSLRVYYSIGSLTVQEDAVLYKGRESTIRTDGAFRQDVSSNTYVSISTILGDLPRLPPSGLENRSIEIFVKPSAGDFVSLPDSLASGNLKVQVFYRPCHIGRV